jgi:hypothetical protein
MFRTFIYPNTTGKTLHLHLIAVQNDLIQIKIYSTDGKLVVKKNIIVNSSTDYPLNIQNLSAGNYFMILSDTYSSVKLQFGH